MLSMLLEQLNALITEHGSAAVLRERLSLFLEQLAAAEAQHRALDTQLKDSQAKIEQMERQSHERQAELDAIKSGRFTGIACDACGSYLLRRIGNRPHPVAAFARAGGRQATFACDNCGAVSGFELRE